MSNVKLLEVKPEEFDENFAYRFKALMSNVKPFIGGTRMKNSVVSKL